MFYVAACEFAVNTRKLLDVVDAQSVSRKRSKTFSVFRVHFYEILLTGNTFHGIQISHFKFILPWFEVNINLIYHELCV